MTACWCVILIHLICDAKFFSVTSLIFLADYRMHIVFIFTHLITTRYMFLCEFVVFGLKAVCDRLMYDAQFFSVTCKNLAFR